MAHPLDHRLGAGYQNERAWANMAEDGNPQVNLDRPAEELLDRDDVVLVRLRAGPGARTGLWWISPGIASRIWRYGPWAAYPRILQHIPFELSKPFQDFWG